MSTPNFRPAFRKAVLQALITRRTRGALGALRWHGYRSENRYTTFQCLAHTLNWPASRCRVLDAAHQERNMAKSEGFLAIEKSNIAEPCALVTELAADTAVLVGEGA